MTGIRAILLPVGEDLYAVAVDVVREVVAAPKITVVPTAPAGVLGVFNLRGTVLPVLDTGQLLERDGLDGAAFAVVVRCGLDEAALITTAVPAVVDLAEQVQPSRAPGTKGTYLTGERLVPLVEPSALLAHAGLRAERHAPTGG